MHYSKQPLWSLGQKLIHSTKLEAWSAYPKLDEARIHRVLPTAPTAIRTTH